MRKFAGNDLKDLLVASLGEFAASSSLCKDFEDSAVVEVGGLQLLMTTDMGPLVGTDLEAAGRISALHALSDIYARGGMPKWALATLIIQSDYPSGAMEAAMKGLVRACQEEGVELKGGHTLVGKEAMLGLGVVGIVQNGELLNKIGAHIGDHLFLSKPLGVGMIVRGYALGLADDDALDEAVAVMIRSNQCASRAAVKAAVNAATDVSGFGLLGHLSEMLAPGQGALVYRDRVPVLTSIRALPSQIARTHWIENNLAYIERQRRLIGAIEIDRIGPLLDPQTNGGLLVAATKSAGETLSRVGFEHIGQVTDTDAIAIINGYEQTKGCF